MRKADIKSMFKYLLVLCFSITLLLSQAEVLHMHVEHNDNSMSLGSALNVHVAGVHSKLIMHDFDLANHHGEHPNNYSTVTIDVGADKLTNKINLLNSLMIVLLFIMLFLASPQLRRVTRQKLYRNSATSCYYLLQPPLRAPPHLK